MRDDKLLKSERELLALSNLLATCSAVTKYDRPGEPESSTLAHAFFDLESSFRSFLDVHLPKLMEMELSDSDIHAVLRDIGEEFRHIAYHLRDPQYYQYLWPESE